MKWYNFLVINVPLLKQYNYTFLFFKSSMLQNVNVISFCDVSKCDSHTDKKEKTNSIFEIM